MVGNVITALTSNAMIAPSFWIDPKNGNDYMLTVQYPETQIQNFQRSARHSDPRRRMSRIPRGSTPFPASRAFNRPPKWITTSCAA